MIDAIGSIAAILTTVAMFPQAIRIIRTRNVTGISLSMYIANSLGIVFWLAYGLLLNAIPIVLANTVAIIPALTILVLKIKLERRDKDSN
ncbi:MAG: SemiSWEET transporter [Breznakibacter sp.]